MAGGGVRMKKTEQKLEDCLRQGESEVVEFKESFHDDAVECLIAFANTRGGVLIVGVADNGSVCGTTVGSESLRKWAQRIAQTTEPPVHPVIQRVEREGRTVVVMEVAESMVKPVAFRGRCFVRAGNANQRMSREEILRFTLDTSGHSWDAQPEPQAKRSDIDLGKVRKLVTRANAVGRRPIPEDDDPWQVLAKLRLTVEGQPTRAAVLLLGVDPRRFYPQATVKAGRFRSPTLIVDDRLIEGDLLAQESAAMLYLRERLQTRFEITGKPERDVIWEYPLEAAREAIVNAICHRDYVSGANIQIRLYDERMEVWNPGALPPPLTPEALLADHESIPRNRLIAEMLYDLGLIEQWGTGTLRMADALRDAGHPSPEFVQSPGGGFRTILRVNPLGESRLRTLELNERQMRALAHLREHGSISNREFRELAEVSRRTAQRDLRNMVDVGVIEAVGTTGRSLTYKLRPGVGPADAP